MQLAPALPGKEASHPPTRVASSPRALRPVTLVGGWLADEQTRSDVYIRTRL